MTINGAIAGIVVGGVTVLVWKNFLAFTNVYEIIPGFILSALAIYVVSLKDNPPAPEVLAKFAEAERLLKE
jgi:sodium/proline symporter